MSRIKLLLDVIEDIRSLADSLQTLADAMLQNGPERADEPVEKNAEPGQKAEKKSTGKKAVKPAPKAEPEKVLTLEEVRAVLAEKSRAGHTAQVRELLIRHGADKLSDIDPAEYPALLADVEVL